MTQAPWLYLFYILTFFYAPNVSIHCGGIVDEPVRDCGGFGGGTSAWLPPLLTGANTTFIYSKIFNAHFQIKSVVSQETHFARKHHSQVEDLSYPVSSERYRNRRQRFGLRFNLIAAIYNLELQPTQ